MDSTVAKRLGCRLHSIQGLHVTVANGDTVRVQKACQGLSWTVQGLKQMTDFLILPLQGCDLVLGVKWLKTLGPIVWDFQALTMRFTIGQKKVTLQGLHEGAILLAIKN